MEPVLVNVWPDAARALGIGRTKAFELVASGDLASVKIGRRRLVVADGLRKYADRLQQTEVPSIDSAATAAVRTATDYADRFNDRIEQGVLIERATSYACHIPSPEELEGHWGGS